MSLGGSDKLEEDDGVLVQAEDAALPAEEYTSPEIAIAEINGILKEYLAKRGDDNSSWQKEAGMALTAFDGFIRDIGEQEYYGRRYSITTREIHEYVIKTLAPTFTSEWAKLIGGCGNSELKQRLLKCAGAWKIDYTALTHPKPEAVPRKRSTPR